MRYEVEIEQPFLNMAELYNNPNVKSDNWAIRTFTLTLEKDALTCMRQGILPTYH